LNRSLLVFVFAAGLLALAAGASSNAWSFEGSGFEDYRIANPVVRDNLAVYFVHGNGTSAAAPISLEQALATGAVKINESAKRPVTIENLSGASVFIPLGTLLVGGLQDQVVSRSLILPPGSGPVALSLFCVDPFRSTARGDEDPTTFSSTGALFPSRMARLAILAAGADTKAVEQIRQDGVWWSIDTLRAQLTRVLGEPLEPAQAATWKNDERNDGSSEVVLRARQSPWRTSLPVALTNGKLAELLAPYLDAYAPEAASDDVIGAVFAVNGRIEGAELYQSHELFGRMWPNLLRAYATQALAASEPAAEMMLPPVSEVEASLAAAGAAPQNPASALLARETAGAIVTETRATDGSLVQRSYVPKMPELALGDASDTPDALVANILQRGEVAGQPLAALRNDDVMVLQNAEPGRWSAAIAPSLAVARAVDPALWPQWERIQAERDRALLMAQQADWQARALAQSRSRITVTAAIWGIVLLLVLVRRRAALGRGVRVCARALAAATAKAGKLIAAPIVAAAASAIGLLAVIMALAFDAAVAFGRLQHALADRAFRSMLHMTGLLKPMLRPAFVQARRP
jgi:hypothetical protein